MATAIYEGENGSLHEIDPARFGENRLDEQVRKGQLTKVDASSIKAARKLLAERSESNDDKALSAMNVAELDEFIASNDLPAELLEVTPKAAKVEAIEAALAA